jgi:8-oxo-dGTP pyrophosphatase MutT (NUDIX family)
LIEEPEVLAAGGVVVRDSEEGPEVALVHRPRYDDWSLPKGKLKPGEGWADAALREVAEETGLRCRLEAELPPSRYTDSKGRRKLVRYWRLRADGGEFAPSDEVDELRWAGAAEAERLLSYPRDRELVRAAFARGR